MRVQPLLFQCTQKTQTNLSQIENAKRFNGNLLEIHNDSFLVDSGYFPKLLLLKWYKVLDIDKSDVAEAVHNVRETVSVKSDESVPI